MENNSLQILTVDEAAELLMIPRSSVYELAQQEGISVQKVSRHWSSHRATLAKWMSGATTIDREDTKFS